MTDEQIEALLLQIPESEEISHSQLMAVNVPDLKILMADRAGLLLIARMCLQATLAPGDPQRPISFESKHQNRLYRPGDEALTAIGCSEIWPENSEEYLAELRRKRQPRFWEQLGCVLLASVLVVLLISGVLFWIQLLAQR